MAPAGTVAGMFGAVVVGLTTLLLAPMAAPEARAQLIRGTPAAEMWAVAAAAVAVVAVLAVLAGSSLPVLRGERLAPMAQLIRATLDRAVAAVVALVARLHRAVERQVAVGEVGLAAV